MKKYKRKWKEEQMIEKIKIIFWILFIIFCLVNGWYELHRQ